MSDKTTIQQPQKQDEQPAASKPRGFVSLGGHLHKWGTYLGIDWIFNTIAGVSFAYWGQFTESGKKYWSGPITGFFTKVLSPIIKDAEQLKKSAGYGNMFMSIIAGGMFTIPPLLILENNHTKRKITEFFDRTFKGNEAVDNDPKFQQAYNEIERAPKKDFWNGITSRFAALTPLLAMVLIPTTKKISNQYWFNHVEKGSEFVAGKVGLSPEKLFPSISAADAQERWKFIHESVAMDFGLGVPYAVMHEAWYNTFTRVFNKEKTTRYRQPDAVPAAQDTTDHKPPSPEVSHVAHDRMLTAAPQQYLAT